MAWDNSNRRRRLPRGWSHQIVPAILKRDRGICHVCKRPGANEVDHVIAGDDHRPSNLAAIHDVPCHRDKTIAERPRPPREKRPDERHPGLT